MRLGAIADDVTGACDLAGRVAEAGLPTTVLLPAPPAPGHPSPTTEHHEDVFAGGDDASACAVVALKVRTAPVGQAVDEATAAAQLLLDAGASLLYQKYCSTFDSTPAGNIGPIADALVALAGADGTVGTPATPGARRTQYEGILFADGVPLAESPMRDHPLTPMRDSSVVRLLAAQTAAPVSLVPWEAVQRGAAEVASAIGAGHTLVDALTEGDLDVIAAAILSAPRPVVAAGGAGVGTALARAAVAASGQRVDISRSQLPEVPVTGRLLLAGSASAATRAQTAAFAGERHTLDPLALATDDRALDRLRDALAARADHREPVLIGSAPEVARAQAELGAERAAALIEGALAELAAFAVHELGYSHLLVAGGETSGAVTARLGVQRLLVGQQVAPGVPWAVARSGEREIALLLKSGNFGGPGLFTDAWEVAP
ncbi:four-carbon acid sugar kinase family protein [Leifsonia sp. F6_8S_P_1B]|uniref:3-oxo-tetronate kinase n=1 Tax=Leifsonia williamsii TaxID=3035919 RepID=A0ABT8K7D1_9MICO|nr:3-oxo-tetronate kinase [Leifsonia williamsii]MDN4613361.1 four-carbon acid sugar kinase family protein [Leifsonia williamsii]